MSPVKGNLFKLFQGFKKKDLKYQGHYLGLKAGQKKGIGKWPKPARSLTALRAVSSSNIVSAIGQRLPELNKS